jgi:5-methylcytosine-specific restriction endonuclease McrA
MQPSERRTDRRYRLQTWRRIRLQVLARDLYRCRVVEGCTERATVADHIVPASLDMPDSLFFAMSNLRAACRMHNIARGFASTLGPQGDPLPVVVPKDYS